jgi:hypothetical protein
MCFSIRRRSDRSETISHDPAAKQPSITITMNTPQPLMISLSIL